ncbi:hypothetical protein HB779_13875 [Phyllobacterium sp. 628]|uniref:hypothetical protein n=1 Tax=Phyllobacterium sp. 628 TaxID=2718938 RepID=UPI0016628131|nr:hypothetical protein [Phyllobacterium sp. 628]QND52873.1 hypothetical protein HB779_13875 [Phyllobacterium sp. 628]
MVTKALMILGTVVCLLLLPLAVLFVGFSVMASDGGVTREALIFFYTMCGWPVCALAGPIGAWLTFKKLGAWALLWFIPCLAYAVVIIGLNLIGS